MKLKFMEGKLGKWIKRILVILVIAGLLAFGIVKLVQNKSSNVEKNALETLENLDSYYKEIADEFGMATD